MSFSPALPTTVRTMVSGAALAKVGQLFNGTARDALVELLQNARRAGATRVAVSIADALDGARLVVRDDGGGVADPALLFALGASGWDDAILAREDPAGMGVFSLAGRAVTVRSRARGAPTGWRVAIAPEAWEAGTPLAVMTDDIACGSEFSIAFAPGWTKDFAQVVAEVARFYSLPVTLAGRDLARTEWLADAVAIEAAAGCRIGVYRDGAVSFPYQQINFHGLAVPCRLPTISEVGGHRPWTVKVDIVDAPALQLVLPARKEMVENAALEALRQACEVALYRAIAAHGEHRLAFDDWQRAHELGVMLPEAARRLTPWIGDFADSDGCRPNAAPLDSERIMLVDCFDPDVAQSAARALGDGAPLGGRLADTVDKFKGYGWYDALPRIVGFAFTIEAEESRWTYGGGELYPELVSGRVDHLMLDVTFANGDHQIVPADVLVISPDWSGLEGATVLVAHDARIEVGALVDLLQAACFSSSDDRDADSWETQHAQFRLDARQLAIELLLSDDEAVLDRVAHEVRTSIRWLVPAGRRILIDLVGGDVAVRFADSATAAA